MNIRNLVLTFLAAAALSGCYTGYGYRGGSGDYYYGSPSVDYYGYGAPYGSLSYGYSDYGYGYGYGYPYGYYGGYYPRYPYYPYYPPHHEHPRPPVQPPVTQRPSYRYNKEGLRGSFPPRPGNPDPRGRAPVSQVGSQVPQVGTQGPVRGYDVTRGARPNSQPRTTPTPPPPPRAAPRPTRVDAPPPRTEFRSRGGNSGTSSRERDRGRVQTP
jgi:hypothetical protein